MQNKKRGDPIGLPLFFSYKKTLKGKFLYESLLM